MIRSSLLNKVCKKCGNALLCLSARLEPQESSDRQKIELRQDARTSPASVLVKEGSERSLYKTRFGDLFWLNVCSCIDQGIVQTGLWEPEATEAVRKIVKKGDVAIDVGANIGYFSVILSKIVGPEGRVYAFEPTTKYHEILKRNLKANGIANCEISRLGLSNKRQALEVVENEASATIHVPEGMPLGPKETIILVTLDDFVREHQLKKIDFIKIDVDGHEPLIFEGAWDTLDKYTPIILTEISQLHFLEAGITAWDFYAQLKNRGYRLYSQAGLSEIENRSAFLIECGNYAYSSNVIISKKGLPDGT